jgi:hypothetical protein
MHLAMTVRSSEAHPANMGPFMGALVQHSGHYPRAIQDLGPHNMGTMLLRTSWSRCAAGRLHSCVLSPALHLLEKHDAISTPLRNACIIVLAWRIDSRRIMTC